MMRPLVLLVVALAVVAEGFGAAAHAAAPGEVIAVEPTELTKRPELAGREVSVDDRVKLFLFHPGRGFDEITLKRTPVVFRLPVALRYRQSPAAPGVRIQGILKREDGRWVCDVTAVELYPKDLVRLNRGVEALPAIDFEKRSAWAAWAERRGKDFQDEELLARAREVDAEATRIEAEHAKSTSDPAAHWLKLARRARDHQVAEPEPSALAHRAFSALAARARTIDEFRALAADVAAFFPAATTPAAVPTGALDRWEAPYAHDPAAAYRAAPEAARKALDHRLWADATQRVFELQGSADPASAISLADQASDQLPDRPQVAAALLEQGLKTASAHLANLRRAEVENLAKLYRTRLGRPDRARELLQSWLEEQRLHHLSPTDAEGRVALAAQYETLINDKAAAAELLRDAWRIDPESREVTDAFRRRGFRKINDEWVGPTEAGRTARAESADEPAAAPRPQSRKLLNLTPKQVRALMGGKPNRIVRSVSLGQVLEQWIYIGATQNQYVNFARTSAESTARVVSYHSLPRIAGSARP